MLLIVGLTKNDKWILHLNIKLNKRVSTAGSLSNRLEKRAGGCATYIKPGSFLHELVDQLTSSCGCTASAGSIVCRGLDVVRIPNPIFWIFKCTCKKSISAGCMATVEELDKVWIKVPEDDDRYCKDAYKGTKTLANSCN